MPAVARIGIHWPELDEDVGIAGLLAGVRPGAARRGRTRSGDTG